MSGLPYPEIAIADVRALALQRVNRSSLRTVSKQIDFKMKHTTLAKFLAGVNPRARVRIMLCEWYARENDEEPSVSAALEILAGFLPDEGRQPFKRGTLEAMAGRYGEVGLEVPGWLAQMMETEP